MARPLGSVRVRLPPANAAMIGGCGAGATKPACPVLIATRIARARSFQNLHRRRVRVAPLLNDCLDLRILARIMRDDATPGADRSAKSGGQLAALAELPFCRRDLGVLRLVQHLARDNPVRLELRVAGPLECRVRVELPLLAGEPRQYDALDRREVAGFQLHDLRGTERSARDVAEQGERIAVLRDAIADRRRGPDRPRRAAGCSRSSSGSGAADQARSSDLERRRTYATYRACDRRSSTRRRASA